MQNHNLVLNPELEAWTAGAPDSWVSQATNTTVRQLDKIVLEDHPWRVRTVVGPGDDYVLNGRFAYRADIAAAGAVDNWRLWPRLNPMAGAEVDATLITMFRVVLGVNDNLLWTENAIVYNTTLTAGFYTPTTFAAMIAAVMAAAGPSVNTYAWVWNGLDRTWTVTRPGGANAFGFQWADPLCTCALLLGFTANDTAAVTYTSDGPSPPGVPFYRSEPNMRWRLNVTARNSVPGNLLRMRVVGMSTNSDDLYYLVQDPIPAALVATVAPVVLPHRWSTVASYLEFRMIGGWAEYGVDFQTHDQRFFIWQISNGTAGAQWVDVGRAQLHSPVDIVQEGQI